jgi:phytoene dehydrogenase-like protein
MLMSRVWRTIKGYLFWTYERGSFHYDVMVTAILLFIFVAPRFINFKDQPAERPQHPTSISVTPDGNQGFVYQVDADAVDAQDEPMVRRNFLRIIRPIAGAVSITRLEPVRDSAGRIVAYRAWVHR